MNRRKIHDNNSKTQNAEMHGKMRKRSKKWRILCEIRKFGFGGVNCLRETVVCKRARHGLG